MNDEELRHALEALPPQDPEIDGWAKRARRTSQTRRGVAAAAVLIVGLGLPGVYLANAWQSGHRPVAPDVLATPSHIPQLTPTSPGEDAPEVIESTPPPSTQIVLPPVDEMTGVVAIRSAQGTDEAELCAVDIEYPDGGPPVCEGPTLKGDFSWDDLHQAGYAVSHGSGVSWTEKDIRVYGYYDPMDGPLGSFTLAGPVAVEATSPSSKSHEQPTSTYYSPLSLCGDPVRTKTGHEEDWQVGTWAFTDAIEVAEKSSGYVEWWLGANDYLNVEVEPGTDVRALENELGAAWGGPICVGISTRLGAEAEEAVSRLLETSMPAAHVAGVGTLNEPGEARVAVTIWGYDADLAGWFRALHSPELEKLDSFTLTVDFVLTPVGTSLEPISIVTR